MSNAFLNQIKQATSKVEDQTKTVEYKNEIAPAGMTTARFVGYVEVGKRMSKANPKYNKAPAPTDYVRVAFELNGPKHEREIEVNGEKIKVVNVKYETVPIKLSDKASFKQLFNKMRAGRDDVTHMAQMLGEPFIIKVVHKKGVGDKSNVTYANIKDDDGNWLIMPPVQEDALTGESRVIPVPEARTALQCLLWDNPTKEMWDSIFIDGTKTVKDDRGQERVVSKNWIQEDIVTNALNFEGSAVEDLVTGLGGLTITKEEDSVPPREQGDPGPSPDDLGGEPQSAPEKPAQAKVEKPVPAPAETPKPAPAPAEKPAAASPAPKAEPKPKANMGDVFAELGLRK